MEKITQEGKGVLLYLLQEGRGIGLFNKLKAYDAAGPGRRHRFSEREARASRPTSATTASGARSCATSGVRRMRLLTNNPSKYVAIDGYGLEIVERVPLEVRPTERTQKYLEAKKNKMGHLLKMV